MKKMRRTRGNGYLSRRRFIGVAAASGVGVAGLLTTGCGDDDDDDQDSPGGTAAASATTDAAPRAGGSVTYTLSTLDLIDPHRVTAGNAPHVLYAIFDGLIDFDADLNMVPQLATSWETTDGQEYVFKLREGVTFHDGTPFNADAVVYNIERLLAPETKSRDAGSFPGLKVQAVDPTTVKFTNSAPSADFLLIIAQKPGLIISPKAIETYGDDVGVSHPVGAGAFEFVEWAKDDHITIRKFPDYWDKPYPYLDEVNYRFVRDSSVVAAGLRSGDFDIGAPPISDLNDMAEDEDFALWEAAGFGNVRDVIFYPTSSALADPRVRQAIMFAIDRETLNEALYSRRHIVPHGIIPPASWAFRSDIKDSGWVYDPARAKQLLEDAGVASVAYTDIIVQSPDTVRLAEAVQAMLGEIGVQVTLEATDEGSRIQRQIAGGIDATQAAFAGRVSIDQQMTINYHSKGGLNYPKYAASERDELIERARSVLREEERAPLYHELEDLVIEDPAPRVPYLFANNMEIVRAGVAMARPAYMPDGFIRFKWLHRT